MAEAIPSALGQAHTPVLGPGAGSLRISEARRRVLERETITDVGLRYPGMDVQPYRGTRTGGDR